MHADFDSTFERDVFIEIESGKVKSERVQENKAKYHREAVHEWAGCVCLRCGATRHQWMAGRCVQCCEHYCHTRTEVAFDCDS